MAKKAKRAAPSVDCDKCGKPMHPRSKECPHCGAVRKPKSGGKNGKPSKRERKTELVRAATEAGRDGTALLLRASLVATHSKKTEAEVKGELSNLAKHPLWRFVEECGGVEEAQSVYEEYLTLLHPAPGADHPFDDTPPAGKKRAK